MIADPVMLPRYRLVDYSPAAEPAWLLSTGATADICKPGDTSPIPTPTNDKPDTRTVTETS